MALQESFSRRSAISALQGSDESEDLAGPELSSRVPWRFRAIMTQSSSFCQPKFGHSAAREKPCSESSTLVRQLCTDKRITRQERQVTGPRADNTSHR